MLLEPKNLVVAVHPGPPHGDDVCATAIAELFIEKKYAGNATIAIVRTRNADTIRKADIVIDVGGEYDPEKFRFDHHQGGIPSRANDDPYASAGLAWKEFGPYLCNNKDVALLVDMRLIAPIDAEDNGTVASYSGKSATAPFTLANALAMIGRNGIDESFCCAYLFAKKLLKSTIEWAQEAIGISTELLKKAIGISDTNALVIIEEEIHRDILEVILPDTIQPHNLIVICPQGATWRAYVIEDKGTNGERTHRILFPKAWRGLEGEELVAVTKVPTAAFCHRRGFTLRAGTYEDAIRLAELTVAMAQ